MKKICVKIGIRNIVRRISAEDISKLYYFKKRNTPRLPKFASD